jgi:hypothetical protein
MSIEASAPIEPFFGKWPIQGLFNEVDPKSTFRIGRMNGRQAPESGHRLNALNATENLASPDRHDKALPLYGHCAKIEFRSPTEYCPL